MSARTIILALVRLAIAVLVVGFAGAAAGFFGAALLGLDGTAAPLNVLLSGPLAVAVGAGVGILATANKWPLHRYVTIVAAAALAMVVLGLALNYFG